MPSNFNLNISLFMICPKNTNYVLNSYPLKNWDLGIQMFDNLNLGLFCRKPPSILDQCVATITIKAACSLSSKTRANKKRQIGMSNHLLTAEIYQL
jgi:hypothetical protein